MDDFGTDSVRLLYEVVPQDFNGFADLSLYGPDRDPKFFCDLRITQSVYPAHGEDPPALLRKITDDPVDPDLEFSSVYVFLDPGIVPVARMLSGTISLRPGFFPDLSVLDVIQAAVPHRIVEVGFQGELNVKIITVFVKLHNQVLDLVTCCIKVLQVSECKHDQLDIVFIIEFPESRFLS